VSSVNVVQKIKKIESLENGEKNSVIVKEFGTSSSMIPTIWKNLDTAYNELLVIMRKTG